MRNSHAIDDIASIPRGEITPITSILIVDDSKSVAMLLGKILENRGYNCILAYNSEEARVNLSEKEFDLVLSDMNMPPGESGLELIRYITKNHLDTATILITAEDDPELGQTAIDLGAFGYIIKPFNNNELIINVSNALVRSRLTKVNRNSQKRLEQMVLNRTKELLETITRLERAEKSLKHSQEETINRLAKAAEFRDNETANHIMRMSRY